MGFLTSSRFVRAFGWFSGLLFVAGAIAFTVTRLADDPAPATNTVPYDPDFVLPDTAPKWTAKDVPKEAQEVAADFVLAAAGREDLARAWTITHPDLKQGLSRKEWLTGNIPIQYYPSERLEGASYTVDELSDDTIVLTLALVPKEGTDVKPQAFFIGLTKKAGKWLVNYWAPRASVPVPASNESG